MIFLPKVLEESEYSRTKIYFRASDGMPQIPRFAEASLLTLVSEQPNRAVAYTTLLKRLEIHMERLASQLKSMVKEKD